MHSSIDESLYSMDSSSSVAMDSAYQSRSYELDSQVEQGKFKYFLEINVFFFYF